MYARASRTVTIALLAALAITVTGCSSDNNATPQAPVTTTGSAAPTSAPAAAPVAGPITSPASGSATRVAVLKAASRGLGVSGTLTVYQLFVQDAAAVGDVKTASGSRFFFALSGGPDAWDLVWSAPFGSTLANADSLTKVDPTAFTGLAGKIDFAKKAPAATTAKPAAAPTQASWEAFALKSAKSFAGSTYTGDFTVTVKIAKDSKGVWWGNAMAEPSDPGLEPIGVWGKFSGGKWTGEIADLSSDGADAGFFPADVLAKLAL
jgi:hypothetical protein